MEGEPIRDPSEHSAGRRIAQAEDFLAVTGHSSKSISGLAAAEDRSQLFPDAGKERLS